MSSEEEIKSKFAKRYQWFAIGSAYLLALLWPLGSYVVWVLLGAISYFVFLIFYYQPRRARGGQEYARWEQKTSSTFKNKISPKVIGIIIFIFVFFSIIIFVVTTIVSFMNDETSFTESIDNDSYDRDALKENPNDLDALTNIGNGFYSSGEYDSALYYYNKILKIDASNSSGLYNKALVFQQQKNYSQSTEVIRQCLSIYPEYTDALLLLGDNYYLDQKYNDAIVWYEKAYDQGARSSALLHIMAYIYETQNRKGDAIRFYKETLAQDSSIVEIYDRLGALEPERASWYKSKADNWR